MKQHLKRLTGLLLLSGALYPNLAGAQATVYSSGTNGKSRGGEQIIITRDSVGGGKMVIEVNGDEVMVNGKKVDGDTDGISVTRRKVRDWSSFSAPMMPSLKSVKGLNINTAMLGVTTERSDEGVSILTVSKNSAAKKAGLEKGDIITGIDDKKIETPDDLSKAIREHKPGDKISVAYLRDKKASKVTATLGKMQSMVVEGYPLEGSFNFDERALGMSLDHLREIPRVYGHALTLSGGAPRLGLTVQDTEDGKGVKVLSVDEEGNAGKAGIEEEDIILEVDGKSINSVDELAGTMKENKEKSSVKFKYDRKGKTNTVEVKVPKKLKTGSL